MKHLAGCVWQKGEKRSGENERTRFLRTSKREVEKRLGAPGRGRGGGVGNDPWPGERENNKQLIMMKRTDQHQKSPPREKRDVRPRQGRKIFSFSCSEKKKKVNPTRKGLSKGEQKEDCESGPPKERGGRLTTQRDRNTLCKKRRTKPKGDRA